MQAATRVDELIRTAIREKRLIQVVYKSKRRIVEPHDYGVRKGLVKLLSYQVGGDSSGPIPNWRWMEADFISDILLLDRRFRGGRPTPSGNHHQWDQLFLRVEPADEEETSASAS